MRKTLTIRLNKELSAWLDEKAAQTGLSRGQLVREQLQKATAHKGHKRYMRLAGIIRGLPKDLSKRKGFSRG